MTFEDTAPNTGQVTPEQQPAATDTQPQQSNNQTDPNTPLTFDQAVDYVSQKTKVPANLLRANFAGESSTDPNTKSSTKGAQGIGQIMPGTAKGLGIDPKDPIQSLVGTAKLLSDGYAQAGKYTDDELKRWSLAVVGYHSGPNGLDHTGSTGGFANWQNDGVKQPDGSYKGGISTKDHLSKILTKWKELGLDLPNSNKTTGESNLDVVQSSDQQTSQVAKPGEEKQPLTYTDPERLISYLDNLPGSSLSGMKQRSTSGQPIVDPNDQYQSESYNVWKKTFGVDESPQSQAEFLRYIDAVNAETNKNPNLAPEQIDRNARANSYFEAVEKYSKDPTALGNFNKVLASSAGRPMVNALIDPHTTIDPERFKLLPAEIQHARSNNLRKDSQVVKNSEQATDSITPLELQSEKLQKQTDETSKKTGLFGSGVSEQAPIIAHSGAVDKFNRKPLDIELSERKGIVLPANKEGGLSAGEINDAVVKSLGPGWEKVNEKFKKDIAEKYGVNGDDWPLLRVADMSKLSGATPDKNGNYTLPISISDAAKKQANAYLKGGLPAYIEALKDEQNQREQLKTLPALMREPTGMEEFSGATMAGIVSGAQDATQTAKNLVDVMSRGSAGVGVDTLALKYLSYQLGSTVEGMQKSISPKDRAKYQEDVTGMLGTTAGSLPPTIAKFSAIDSPVGFLAIGLLSRYHEDQDTMIRGLIGDTLMLATAGAGSYVSKAATSVVTKFGLEAAGSGLGFVNQSITDKNFGLNSEGKPDKNILSKSIAMFTIGALLHAAQGIESKSSSEFAGTIFKTVDPETGENRFAALKVKDGVPTWEVIDETDKLIKKASDKDIHTVSSQVFDAAQEQNNVNTNKAATGKIGLVEEPLEKSFREQRLQQPSEVLEFTGATSPVKRSSDEKLTSGKYSEAKPNFIESEESAAETRRQPLEEKVQQVAEARDKLSQFLVVDPRRRSSELQDVADLFSNPEAYVGKLKSQGATTEEANASLANEQKKAADLQESNLKDGDVYYHKDEKGNNIHSVWDEKSSSWKSVDEKGDKTTEKVTTADLITKKAKFAGHYNDIFPEGELKYDKENQPGIQSNEQVGEKPVETKPESGGGKEEAGNGGVVQKPSEEVAPKTKPITQEEVEESKKNSGKGVKVNVNLNNGRTRSGYVVGVTKNGNYRVRYEGSGSAESKLVMAGDVSRPEGVSTPKEGNEPLKVVKPATNLPLVVRVAKYLGILRQKGARSFYHDETVYTNDEASKLLSHSLPGNYRQGIAVRGQTDQYTLQADLVPDVVKNLRTHGREGNKLADHIEKSLNESGNSATILNVHSEDVEIGAHHEGIHEATVGESLKAETKTRFSHPDSPVEQFHRAFLEDQADKRRRQGYSEKQIARYIKDAQEPGWEKGTTRDDSFLELLAYSGTGEYMGVEKGIVEEAAKQAWDAVYKEFSGESLEKIRDRVLIDINKLVREYNNENPVQETSNQKVSESAGTKNISNEKPASSEAKSTANRTTTPEPGSSIRQQGKDSGLARDTENKDKEEPKASGLQFAKFFNKTVSTKAGGANTEDAARFATRSDTVKRPAYDSVVKYRDNFSNHIWASIPGKLEEVVGTVEGITKALPKGGNVLDIAGSGGEFAKAIAEHTKGKVAVDSLDASPAMEKSFNSTEVKGAKFILGAWGESFTDPDFNQEIPEFKPDKKYDVVHESMAFQFFSKGEDRGSQIDAVKAAMNPDGVFITSEKFTGTPDYDQREATKNNYKEQFFDKAQLEAKAKEVGLTTEAVKEKAEQAAVGMLDLQANKTQYEKELQKRFKYVGEFWESGNFSAYVATDSAEKFSSFVNGAGDLNSPEFSRQSGTRVIQSEPSGLARQAGLTGEEKTPEEARRKIELDHYTTGKHEDLLTSFMGTAQSGRETSREERVPRLYYYFKGTEPEARFKNYKKLDVSADLALYDIAKDPLKIREKYDTPTDVEKAIRDRGFDGLYNSSTGHGDTFDNVVAVFRDLKANKPTEGLSRDSYYDNFYSPIEKLVEERLKDKEKISVEQLNGLFGIKKDAEGKIISAKVPLDEIGWTDTDDYIQRLKEGGVKTVTKENILDYLRDNRLQLKEVQKISNPKELDFQKTAEFDGLSAWVDAESDYTIVNNENGKFTALDNHGDEIGSNYSNIESAKYVAEEHYHSRNRSQAKYGIYTHPGGDKNYREIVIHLPKTKNQDIDKWENLNKKLQLNRDVETHDQLMREMNRLHPSIPTYYDSHYTEPNILLHTRVSDYIDRGGNKVLLAHDFQSGAHQEAREKGYINNEKPFEVFDAKTGESKGLFKTIKEAEQYLNDHPEDRNLDYEDNRAPAIRSQSKVPDLPYKNNKWIGLGVKRLLYEAASKGYDKLGWVTGEQVADMLGLSNQISRLQWNKKDSLLVAYSKEDPNHSVLQEEGVNEENLAKYVGDDAANKLMANNPKFEGSMWRELSDVDLKMGPEKMRPFYDNIVVNEVNKILKKWGVRTQDTNINGQNVHSVVITPEMRGDILNKRLGLAREPKSADKSPGQEAAESIVRTKLPDDYKPNDVETIVRYGKFANISGRTDENINTKKGIQAAWAATDKLRKDLDKRGITVFTGNGKYFGESEPTLFIPLKDSKELPTIRALAKKYGQKQIVEADNGSYNAPFTTGENTGEKKNFGSVLVTGDQALKNENGHTEVFLPSGEKFQYSITDLYDNEANQTSQEKSYAKDAETIEAISKKLSRAKTTEASAIVHENLEPKTKNLPVQVVAKKLMELTQKVLGPMPKGISEEEKSALLIKRAVADGVGILKYQFDRYDRNYRKAGITWYSKDMARLFELTGQAFPDMATDARQKLLFDMQLGITSPRSTPGTNFNSALDLYSRILGEFNLTSTPIYKEGINKKTGKPLQYGISSPALEKVNYGMQGYRPTDTAELKSLLNLPSTSTAGEVYEALEKSKLDFKPSEEFFTRAGSTKYYLKDPELQKSIDKYGYFGGFMEYLLQPSTNGVDVYKATEFLGPKAGAFFLNLGGFHQIPTADMWVSRWWNRIAGTDEYGPKKPKETSFSFDAPKSQAEGDTMRAALQGISEKWNSLHPNNPEMWVTPADAQSAMWFFEKDFSEKGGARKTKQDSFLDYAEDLVKPGSSVNKKFANRMTPEQIEARQSLIDSLEHPIGPRTKKAHTQEARDENKGALISRLDQFQKEGLGRRTISQKNKSAMENFDSSTWRGYMEDAKGKPLDPIEDNKLYNLIQQGLNAGTDQERFKAYAGLSDLAAHLAPKDFSDYALQMIRAAKLSGIYTPIKTALSATTHNIAIELQRAVAAPVDATLALLKGTDRQVQGVSPRGVYYAMQKGFTEGLQNFKDTMMTGQNQLTGFQPDAGHDPISGISTLDNSAGWLAKYLLRFHGAEFALFKTYAYHRALYETGALTEKNSKGARTLQDVLLTPSAEESDTAMRAAEFATFMNNNPLNTAYNNIRGSEKMPKAARLLLDSQLPFPKIGTNVALRVADYMPLIGIAKEPAFAKLFGKALAEPENQKAISLAIGRQSLGALFGFIGYALAAKGMAVGYPTEDQGEKNLREKERVPYSGGVKIGGKWYSVDEANPIGGIVKAGASYYYETHKHLSDKEEGKASRPLNAAAAVLGFLDDMPFYKTGHKLTDPKELTRSLSGFTSDILNPEGVIPNFVAQIASTQDKYQRNTKGATEAETSTNRIKAKLPKTPFNPNFNRESLPMKIDVAGNPVEQGSSIIPFRPSAAKEDALDVIIRKTGYSWSKPKMKDGETPVQFQQRSVKEGKASKSILDDIIQQKVFKTAPNNEVQKQILTEAVTTAKSNLKTKKYDDESLKQIVRSKAEMIIEKEMYKQTPEFKKLSEEEQKKVLTKFRR